MLDESETRLALVIGSNAPVIQALPPATVLNWLETVGVEGARRIGRHLPSPDLNNDGTGRLPAITAQVLERYGDDQEVFESFVAGRHNLEASWGPVSSHYEGHIRLAQAFLNHPVPLIRRWAQAEIASAKHFAQIWSMREEDESFSG